MPSPAGIALLTGWLAARGETLVARSAREMTIARIRSLTLAHLDNWSQFRPVFE